MFKHGTGILFQYIYDKYIYILHFILLYFTFILYFILYILYTLYMYIKFLVCIGGFALFNKVKKGMALVC